MALQQVQGLRWAVDSLTGERILQQKYQDVATGDISYINVPEEIMERKEIDPPAYFKNKTGRTSTLEPHTSNLPKRLPELNSIREANVHKIACVGALDSFLDMVEDQGLHSMTGEGSLLIDVDDYFEKDGNEGTDVDVDLLRILAEAKNKGVTYVYLYA